jgi:hypothetical protein
MDCVHHDNQCLKISHDNQSTFQCLQFYFSKLSSSHHLIIWVKLQSLTPAVLWNIVVKCKKSSAVFESLIYIAIGFVRYVDLLCTASFSSSTWPRRYILTPASITTYYQYRKSLIMSISDKIILLVIIIAITIAILFCIVESSQSNTLYPRHLHLPLENTRKGRISRG